MKPSRRAQKALPAYLQPVPGPSPLPELAQSWPLSRRDQRELPYLDPEDVSLERVREYARSKPWQWPTRLTYFLCDIHADADALVLSLEASGGIERTGPGDTDYELSPAGRSAKFVIGGDCFDKGPETLRLLRCLRHLIDVGADVTILAGNHDLRTYLGLAYAGRRETRFQHLFVRMGKKTLPLFKEIVDQRLRLHGRFEGLLDAAEVRRRLYPTEEWYGAFEAEARDIIPELKLLKELKRIREKTADLDATSQQLDLTLGEIYAAAEEAKRMFLEPTGEFSWYFERMTLAHKDGSFLFVHAGVDDQVAAELRRGGLARINAWYDELVREDLFELYHGPIGNAFRTKYRDIDHPLTDAGIRDLCAAGIYAVVHGHRNILRGQRITLRANLLNFECDASVDRNTRKLEGLSGPGGAVMVFEPHGQLRGISTDYPFIKTFDAARAFEFTSLVTGTGLHRRGEQAMKKAAVQGAAETEAPKEVAVEREAESGKKRKRKTKVKFEAKMQRDEAVVYLRALVSGLAGGHFELKDAEGMLELAPTEQLSLEVKGSEKGTKQKVSIELEWQAEATSSGAKV